MRVRSLNFGDHKLDRRLRSIILLYLLLVAAIIGYNANATSKERGAALALNVAARQRALAERYVKDTLLVAQGIQADPHDDGVQLLSNANALIDGGQVEPVQGASGLVMIAPASADTSIIAKLQEERRLIQLLIPAGEALAATPPTDTAFPALLEQLRVIGAQVTSISNDAVGQMTADTQGAFGRLVTVGIGLGILGALAAVGMGLALRRMGSQRSAQFRSLVNNASDLLTVVDEHGEILYVSPSAERLIGRAPEELVGTNYLHLLEEGDDDHVRALLREVMAESDNVATGDYRILHIDGSTRHMESIVTNLTADPLVTGLVLNTRDVTDRKALEDELAHQAFHDSLTGLSNRAVFRDRLEHALANTGRSGRQLTVLILDLDGFKLVNDSLGHDAGDELLIAVGARIQSSARVSDTVARLGGDEFAILMEDEGDVTKAKVLAVRLLNDLTGPFQVQGHEIFIRGSVGMAVSSATPITTDEMIRNADTAMYVAKAAGKGRVEVFEPSMHARVVQRFEVQAELQRALTRDEFVVHYQPIVDFKSEAIGGVEALVRWDHPTRGLLPPLEFIGVAEDTGLIVPLGRWVLGEASRQAAEWRARSPESRGLWVSVNLSTRQLLEPDLVAQVRDVLEETELEPSALILEITEGSLMQDVEQTAVKLRGLKELGVRLAIDDFGTGASSLGYLRQFPIDLLKIDKSFVDDVTTQGSNGPALVKAIIDLAHTLNLETVAEGIEMSAQLAELRAVGCHSGQGFLFSKPLVPLLLEALLDQDGTSSADAWLDAVPELH